MYEVGFFTRGFKTSERSGVEVYSVFRPYLQSVTMYCTVLYLQLEVFIGVRRLRRKKVKDPADDESRSRSQQVRKNKP